VWRTGAMMRRLWWVLWACGCSGLAALPAPGGEGPVSPPAPVVGPVPRTTAGLIATSGRQADAPRSAADPDSQKPAPPDTPATPPRRRGEPGPDGLTRDLVLRDSDTPLPAEAILDALDQLPEREFRELPLRDVLQQLAEWGEFNLFIEEPRASNPPSPDPLTEKISYSCGDASLEAVLEELLRRRGLDWHLRHDCLWVAPVGDVARHQFLRVYDASAILRDEVTLARLVQTVSRAILPGALGPSAVAGTGSALLVRGSQNVQREVAGLLAELEELALEAEDLPGKQPAPQVRGPRPLPQHSLTSVGGARPNATPAIQPTRRASVAGVPRGPVPMPAGAAGAACAAARPVRPGPGQFALRSLALVPRARATGQGGTGQGATGQGATRPAIRASRPLVTRPAKDEPPARGKPAAEEPAETSASRWLSALEERDDYELPPRPLLEQLVALLKPLEIPVVYDANRIDADVGPGALKKLRELRLRNVRLESALGVLLEPEGLTWIIHLNRVLITSQKRAAEERELKAYDVANLLEVGHDVDELAGALERLLPVLPGPTPLAAGPGAAPQAAVAGPPPGVPTGEGPTGSVQGVGEVVVIRASQPEQWELAQVLAELDELAVELAERDEGWSPPWEWRMYAVPPAAAEGLAKSLPELVPEGAWRGTVRAGRPAGEIRPLPGVLLVRQTARIHSRIARLLGPSGTAPLQKTEFRD